MTGHADLPAARIELTLLERRPHPGARGDTVDHPRSGHDDQAIAAVGSLLLASRMSGTSDVYGSNVEQYASDHDPLAQRVGYQPRRAIRHPELLPPNLRCLADEEFDTASPDRDPLNR